MREPTADAVAAERSDRRWYLDRAAWTTLVERLLATHDEVIGPVFASGVVRLRRLTGVDDLAVGVVDHQGPGTYRATRSASSAHFASGPAPDSLKAIVHPADAPVWTMRRRDGTLSVELAPTTPVTRAVIGVRDCDLRALRVLERTQTTGPHPDPGFIDRRAGLFVVAADCTRPAATCCCISTGGGPQASDGFDIAVSELDDDPEGVVYVARAGSARGADLLDMVGTPGVDAALTERVERALADATDAIVRSIHPDARSIVGAADHPRWSSVAERCLACGNCTAVCPTCFCTDLVDDISLDGQTSTRRRVWDTCFSEQYSALAGSPHRASTAARYRQWLTHKVGTWWDQYGESGCVGCGRCTTWCPVGIDIVEEIDALLEPEAMTS